MVDPPAGGRRRGDRRKPKPVWQLSVIVGSVALLTVVGVVSYAESQVESIFTESRPELTGSGWADCEVPITWSLDTTRLTPAETKVAVEQLTGDFAKWGAASGLTFEYVGEVPVVYNDTNFVVTSEQHPSDRRQIIIEVTERGIPDSLGMMALHGMSRRGVRVALDDVTMNGTNLAFIARCDFDIIKIDRSLIAGMDPNGPDPNWLRGLAGLLSSMDLTVVAEGIETDAQFKALQAAGVQMGQGYHFSRPLPASELIAYHDRTRQSPP